MYYFPSIGDPIRQGDIFRWLPKLELVVGDKNLPILTEQKGTGFREIDWIKSAKDGASNAATVLVKPVYGIVITQDCDASRAPQIIFSEVVFLKDIFSSYQEDSTKPLKLTDLVTEQSRKNQKWFYLAENKKIGFDRKMSVDFQSVFMVPRDFLVTYTQDLRIGRLDDEVAYPHFRERVSDYFRRYPYNEWYPFNTTELAAYEADKKYPVDIRYKWQN